MRRHLLGAAAAVALLASCGASEPERTSATSPSTTVASSATSTTSAPASTSTTTVAPASSTSTSGSPSTTSTTRPTAPPSTAKSPNGSIAGLVVVIDPGHNGQNYRHTAEINAPVDAGGFQKACNTTGTATNSGYSESAFSWAVAQLVADDLRARGATVALTRTSDDGWGPCVDERGRTAAENGADVLVSIHADGADAGAHGFHLIHPGAVPGYTDGIVAESDRLAMTMRDSLVGRGLSTSNYIGSQGLIERTDLGTLNLARVPAVMLEAGNMRDPGDAAFLTSTDGQVAVAAGIVDGLTAWWSAGG